MATIAAKIVSVAKNQSVGGKKSIKLEMIGKHMLQPITKKQLVGGCNDGWCDVGNYTFGRIRRRLMYVWLIGTTSMV